MKKFILFLLCVGMAACGFAYYQDTLAMSDQKDVLPGQGIRQVFCDRNGKPVDNIVLYPAVYGDDFDPARDLVERFWDSEKIAGAQDHILRVTNQGSTPCYYRTYIALENGGDVFDRMITVNWGEGVKVEKLAETLSLPDETGNMNSYRVCLLTTEEPLEPGATAEPLLQLFMSRWADHADIRALGPNYTVRAATEAIWLPAVGDPEYDAISLNLLGPATIEHAKELFTKD